MRVLNLLNGPAGWQVGIEDGFESLRKNAELSDVHNIYLKSAINHNGLTETLDNIYHIVKTQKIEVVIFYHISGCNIPRYFFKKIKSLAPKITLVYDEHDGYERFRKPFSKGTKIAMAESHIISLCGLGSIVKLVNRKYRYKIIYTPHQTTIHRFDSPWTPTKTRKYDVVMIGNRLTSRFPFKRLSGAHERELVVAKLGEVFGRRFAVYGNGWDGFTGNKGPLEYEKQFDAIRESWISVGVDHCTKMSYYFSDRLPISMCAGVAHICHYHDGYELLFDQGKDLVWFKNPEKAVDVIRVELAKGPEHLIRLGQNGSKTANRKFAPTIVWRNMMNSVRHYRSKQN